MFTRFVFGVSTFAALSGPAHASRPLIRTAIAIKNIEMSIPITLDEAVKRDVLGLDRELKVVRDKILRDAREYTDLRTGKKSRMSFARWVDTCEAAAGTLDENPYCRFEKERKNQGNQKSSRAPREATLALVSALRDGRYEVANDLPAEVLSRALRSLDGEGSLQEFANRLADSKNCYSSALTYLTGYKLEEQFPDENVIGLTEKIYRHASECASPGEYYGAQASFRYALIEIWKKKFTEIPALMSKVEASAEASNFHARAKFWRYFVANQTGHQAQKMAAREALLRDHPLSFQNLAVTGDDPTALAQILHTNTARVAVRSVVRTDLNATLRGIEALLRLGQAQMAADLVDKSVAEIASLEPDVRLYVALLMNRAGYALPKFKILSALFQDVPTTITADTMRLFFPLWYADVVRKEGRQVDPLLILSLIRQESAFNKQARSSVGARGLMQVMPATARTVASIRKQKLFDPETNINVGTKYLSQRLRQYEGDVELTLAAYNAGFARVDSWKKRYPTDNRMLFLDFIPFRETRDYVSSILRNYYWYVKLYDEAEASKVQAIMNANAGTVPK